MTGTDVQGWLDRYVQAWRSLEPALIGDLFTEDASYAYHPWDTGDTVVRGRDAIVANWLQDPDEPDSWTGEYQPLLVDGDRAVATGETRYTDGENYRNLWVLRFVDGRCAEFTEWYMTAPPSPTLD
jgi:ketosteroid isomerase-like protein